MSSWLLQHYHRLRLPWVRSQRLLELVCPGVLFRLGQGHSCTRNLTLASSFANAVANFIGVRFYSLPITSVKVLAALKEGPEATLPATRYDLLDAAIAAEAEGSGD